MKRTILFVAGAVALAALVGCGIEVPEGLEVVREFELDRYLGTWYEIARLDHRFERGLTNVTAEYSLKEDGTVSVLNRGYDAEKKEWKEARGKARFIGDSSVGSLKVSFFGPFWGGYHIVALDHEGYRYAMVAGPKRSYLWILAREKTLDAGILERLVDQARQAGFETDKLIYVEQSPVP